MTSWAEGSASGMVSDGNEPDLGKKTRDGAGTNGFTNQGHGEGLSCILRVMGNCQ